MDATEWATWVSAIAATVAAGAAVAVWWRGRTSPEWRLEQAGSGTARVVNSGNATAKTVHVRVGSESDETNVEAERHVESVAPGEAVPISLAPDNDSAEDVALIVTWRGRFGRRETWTYRIL